MFPVNFIDLGVANQLHTCVDNTLSEMVVFDVYSLCASNSACTSTIPYNQWILGSGDLLFLKKSVKHSCVGVALGDN